jgi:hypothetical protein
MECENILICKFLQTYPEEKQIWYYKYCGNKRLAERCERLKWCNCKGTEKPPIDYCPDGRTHL